MGETEAQSKVIQEEISVTALLLHRTEGAPISQRLSSWAEPLPPLAMTVLMAGWEVSLGYVPFSPYLTPCVLELLRQIKVSWRLEGA